MRYLNKAALCLLSAAAFGLMALPAEARRGFDSQIASTLTGPVKVEVQLSEEMAYRSINLTRSLRDRCVAGL